MMARQRRPIQFALARVWAYPLWYSAIHSESADDILEDVDWWTRCIDDEQLLRLDRYTQFAFLAGALREFRSLLHFRLRAAPLMLRVLLRILYRPEPSLTIDAKSIGPGFFIQHGFATIVVAETIGRRCWVNQQVTIGYTTKGKPTLGNNVRVGAGAVVLGPITLHDGASVGANATVVHDVGPGQTLVAPPPVALTDRRDGGGDPSPRNA